MSTATVAVIAATVFIWGLVSGRLERNDVTAPIVFVAVGVLMSRLVVGDTHIETESTKLLTEITLVWVLFSDAAGVALSELRADLGLCVRLLAVALPVTVVLGWLTAQWLFSGLDVWLAVLVGAALAPTDAALEAPVISNPAVPVHLRAVLNVESGLNDGIVTPVVMVALAGAAAAEGAHGGGAVHAVRQLLLGAAVGLTVGVAAGLAQRHARRRGWMDEEFAGPAVLALAIGVYAGAISLGGNGFVAAFAAGAAYGNAAGGTAPKQVFFVEQTAATATFMVWAVFGLVGVPLVVDAARWQLLAYAALSLTAIRMLPVLLVLVTADVDARTALFVGWFGPRGLASVVFALLAVEQLGAASDTAVAVISTTVLVSVLAHGVTAAPLARRYGPVLQAGGEAVTTRTAPPPVLH